MHDGSGSNKLLGAEKSFLVKNVLKKFTAFAIFATIEDSVIDSIV